LKHNATLENLDLFRNQIANDGAEALADASKQNATLEELNLLLNPLTEEAQNKLEVSWKAKRDVLEGLYLF